MPTLPAEPSPPAAAGGIPCLTFTGLTCRVTFATLLAGATGLIAFGQQISVQGPNSRPYALPFIIAGARLFLMYDLK